MPVLNSFFSHVLPKGLVDRLWQRFKTKSSWTWASSHKAQNNLQHDKTFIELERGRGDGQGNLVKSKSEGGYASERTVSEERMERDFP